MSRAGAKATACPLTWVAAGLVALCGCHGSSVGREGLVSPYPLDRVQAAVLLAESGDAQAVDQLIELLEDRDRGVRMYAILALERLCGQTYGYKYYDPEPQRAAAVARWREARQRGQIELQARSDRGASTTAGVSARSEQSREQAP